MQQSYALTNFMMKHFNCWMYSEKTCRDSLFFWLFMNPHCLKSNTILFFLMFYSVFQVHVTINYCFHRKQFKGLVLWGKWLIPLRTSCSRFFHTRTFKPCQKPHEQWKNNLFSYELVVSGYFTHKLLCHAKNHMNNYIFWITYTNYRF